MSCNCLRPRAVSLYLRILLNDLIKNSTHKFTRVAYYSAFCLDPLEAIRVIYCSCLRLASGGAHRSLDRRCGFPRLVSCLVCRDPLHLAMTGSLLPVIARCKGSRPVFVGRSPFQKRRETEGAITTDISPTVRRRKVTRCTFIADMFSFRMRQR